MKALLCTITLLLSTFNVSAAVVKSFDDKNECTRFSLRHEKNGEALKLDSGESLHLKGAVYGFTFRDPSVDFEGRQVTVRAEILKFGLNKDLHKRVILKEDKVDVDAALEQLNKKVLTMDEVCINQDGELIDFKIPK